MNVDVSLRLCFMLQMHGTPRCSLCQIKFLFSKQGAKMMQSNKDMVILYTQIILKMPANFT